MEKVFGYVRVSTQKQVVKGFGISTQRYAIKKYCQEHNLELVQVFIDKGVSGTVVDRPGLTDLLAAFNGIRKVVVLNTSRLWRDDTPKVMIQKTLKLAKADVISIEQPNYSIYSHDPSDYITNAILEALDQYERLNINLKLAKGRRTKARAGSKACGVAPLGYRWTSNAKIETDPEGAAIVQLIYDSYLELESISKVKQYLDEQLLTTQRGKSFSKQAIADILSNDFYIGVVTHGAVKTTGTHEAIIKKTIFKKAQSRLMMNRRNKIG
jgi:DNA invertase Pin-like site-specific DNA recombinase